jgi:hypothetical protein
MASTTPIRASVTHTSTPPGRNYYPPVTEKSDEKPKSDFWFFRFYDAGFFGAWMLGSDRFIAFA